MFDLRRDLKVFETLVKKRAPKVAKTLQWVEPLLLSQYLQFRLLGAAAAFALSDSLFGEQVLSVCLCMLRSLSQANGR